jgi:hypothetical protein
MRWGKLNINAGEPLIEPIAGHLINVLAMFARLSKRRNTKPGLHCQRLWRGH